MGRGDEITKVAESRGGGKSFTGLEHRGPAGVKPVKVCRRTVRVGHRAGVLHRQRVGL